MARWIAHTEADEDTQELRTWVVELDENGQQIDAIEWGTPDDAENPAPHTAQQEADRLNAEPDEED